MPKYLVKSEQASKNRKSEKKGPGTGILKHTNGTKSFASHKETLEDYERRLEEMTHASPNVPVDEDELFYDISQRDPKGRICGLGSYVRPTHDGGGTSSSQWGDIEDDRGSHISS
ncbi:hypothetical protein Syun_017018 [Stephania yunnanensis]|uniref:Uncharacterized protein n=1 Tax=Stephania yunnanensis TaxID=152371 RepID=A0AAP0J8F6_9MAGN